MDRKRKMAFKLILFTAMALFISANSNSALIDIDWQNSGDNLIIRDASSGLDWLDLRVTADLSHDTVVANLVPGGDFYGFRLATQAEVLELWANAGITNNERIWVTGQFAAVKDLVDRLGVTTMFEEGLFPIAKHTIGMVEGGPALPHNERWAMEITYAPDDLHTRTSANYYTWDVSVADHHYSTYLVQAVPLPATISWSETNPLYNQNDIFTLNIVGTDFINNVDGGGVNISFNASVLKVISVSIDEMVWDFGGAGVSTGVIDNVSGTVDGIMVNTLSNVSGDFIVASIEFQVIAEGSSLLSITEFGLNPWSSGGSTINPDFVSTIFRTSAVYVRDGDLNLDGQVNAGDVFIAFRIALGLVTASTEQIEHGDVAPLIAGVPDPDGVINVADAFVIQRKVLGLVSFP